MNTSLRSVFTPHLPHAASVAHFSCLSVHQIGVLLPPFFSPLVAPMGKRTASGSMHGEKFWKQEEGNVGMKMMKVTMLAICVFCLFGICWVTI